MADSMDRGSGANVAGGMGFTEAEQQKITETEKLITAKAADGIVRSNKYLAIDSKFKLTGQTL
ncbi:hypothetical protein SDC9_197576 [bioreactor metagenome]|uniref:Uncharacterized protein n=1 Tax=bioreactor metagenome TaxID=1076179 RepID=A0A645IGH9_9ZZZZ